MSKFVLWVNGHDYYFDTYQEAFDFSIGWFDRGFDDVTIEEVTDE